MTSISSRDIDLTQQSAPLITFVCPSTPPNLDKYAMQPHKFEISHLKIIKHLHPKFFFVNDVFTLVLSCRQPLENLSNFYGL